MKTRVSLLLGAACSAILFSNVALAQSAYTAVQLDGFFFNMNNSGQAAGIASSGAYSYTDANGLGLHTLDTPAGYSITGPLAINNLGQVAGAYTTNDGSFQGFYTTTSGAVVSTSANGQLLPAINDINDKGQMVAFNRNVGAPLTSQNGTVWQPISALDSGVDSYGQPNRVVLSINTRGQLAGMNFANYHAFFASADGSTVTEPINSLNGFSDTTLITRLNDKGQLLGDYQDANGNDGVYLTGPDGAGITTIDGLFGAMGLNNAGQIAGFSHDAFGNLFAVITGDNGQNAVDLNTLYSLAGDSFTQAVAINDVGQVLAFTANGNEYLLTPVPEASTSMLMLLGLCGLGLARRRKH